jgi:hypothetical protein
MVNMYRVCHVHLLKCLKEPGVWGLLTQAYMAGRLGIVRCKGDIFFGIDAVFGIEYTETIVFSAARESPAQERVPGSGSSPQAPVWGDNPGHGVFPILSSHTLIMSAVDAFEALEREEKLRIISRIEMEVRKWGTESDGFRGLNDGLMRALEPLRHEDVSEDPLKTAMKLLLLYPPKELGNENVLNAPSEVSVPILAMAICHTRMVEDAATTLEARRMSRALEVVAQMVQQLLEIGVENLDIFEGYREDLFKMIDRHGAEEDSG